MPKKILWWVLGSGVLMVLAAFGTWVVAANGDSFEGWQIVDDMISGTEGSNDGWLVVVAAAIGGGLSYFRRASKDAGLWALLGGVAGLAVTAYDRGNMQLGKDFAGDHPEAGWGLYLALIASISMAIAGIVALVQARSASAAAEQSLDT